MANFQVKYWEDNQSDFETVALITIHEILHAYKEKYHK